MVAQHRGFAAKPLQMQQNAPGGVARLWNAPALQIPCKSR
jgi:hypothetical protein